MSKITYTQVGNYLLPDITLNEPLTELVVPIGRYGRMYKAYLKEHRLILYNQLLLKEKLFPLLREIDEAANNRKLCGVSDEAILAELIYS